MIRLPQPKVFEIGETVWIYGVGNPFENKPMDGKIVRTVDLGFQWPHYIVEIDTPMDPFYEVRDGFGMHRENPEPPPTLAELEDTLKCLREREAETEEELRRLREDVAEQAQLVEKARAGSASGVACREEKP